MDKSLSYSADKTSFPFIYSVNTTAVSLPPDPEITPAVIAKHGITPEEYERIQKILGRKPNFTELGIFSVMRSEHCSYKNSKPELK